MPIMFPLLPVTCTLCPDGLRAADFRRCSSLDESLCDHHPIRNTLSQSFPKPCLDQFRCCAHPHHHTPPLIWLICFDNDVQCDQITELSAPRSKRTDTFYWGSSEPPIDRTGLAPPSLTV